MDKHQHDAQPPSGRRKFLSQLGMTAVATAALSGLADVVGLKPAAAATRAKGNMKVRGARQHASLEPATATYTTFTCELCQGCCGAPCTPTGVYCHQCWASTYVNGSGNPTSIYDFGYICVGGGSNFTLT
jgi:anaerobic selenocysteine-containing dehydrogenase